VLFEAKRVFVLDGVPLLVVSTVATIFVVAVPVAMAVGCVGDLRSNRPGPRGGVTITISVSLRRLGDEALATSVSDVLPRSVSLIHGWVALGPVGPVLPACQLPQQEQGHRLEEPERCREMQRDAQRCREMQRDAERCREMQIFSVSTYDWLP
jgi:hypothetical protein